MIPYLIECAGHEKDTAAGSPIHTSGGSEIPGDYLLPVVDEKVFKLDTDDSGLFSSVCYFSAEGEDYFTCLDYQARQISIFNYWSGEKVRSISLAPDGPNDVGLVDLNMTHFMTSLDIIFLINTWNSEVYILNGAGQKTGSLNYANESLEGQACSAYSFLNTPIRKLQDRIFIHVSPAHPSVFDHDFSKIPSLLSIGMDGTIEYHFPLPPVYNQGFWGSEDFKYLVHYLYDEQTKTFILGFSVDPVIYNTAGDSYDPVEQKNFRSKYGPAPVPFSEDKLIFEKEEMNRERNVRYALTSSDYNYFLKDPVSGLVLRMVYIRPSIEKFERGKRIPDFSFLIIDQDDLSVLGESQIFSGATYFSNLSFINDRGLHLARWTENENALKFDVFQIARK